MPRLQPSRRSCQQRHRFKDAERQVIFALHESVREVKLRARGSVRVDVEDEHHD